MQAATTITNKSGYLTVALAPILTFGVLFAAILPLVPQGWFWVVYLLQVINLSGAAGDLFVTVRFARLPKDIAVRDCGVSMTVYSKRRMLNENPRREGKSFPSFLF